MPMTALSEKGAPDAAYEKLEIFHTRTIIDPSARRFQPCRAVVLLHGVKGGVEKVTTGGENVIISGFHLFYFTGKNMRRLTISVEDDLAEEFDRLVEHRGYLNRSEAFRDLVRKELGQATIAEGHADWCVATLTYVYDHHERQLADRLTKLQHDHHDVIVATQHIHLDHDNCIEMLFLRGRTDSVRACANLIVSQTGVRHGNAHIIPADIQSDRHDMAGHRHVHPHR